MSTPSRRRSVAVPHKRKCFNDESIRREAEAREKSIKGSSQESSPRSNQSAPYYNPDIDFVLDKLQRGTIAGSKLDDVVLEPVFEKLTQAVPSGSPVVKKLGRRVPRKIDLVSSVSEMADLIDLPETPFDIDDTPYYRDLINRLRTSYKKIKTEYRNLDSRISRYYYDSDELKNFTDIVFELKNHRDNPHHRKNYRTVLGIPEFDATRYDHAVLQDRGPMYSRFTPLSMTSNPEIGIPFPRDVDPEYKREYEAHMGEQIGAIPPERQVEIDQLFAETGPEYNSIINSPNRIEATLRWWILHAKMTFFFNNGEFAQMVRYIQEAIYNRIELGNEFFQYLHGIGVSIEETTRLIGGLNYYILRPFLGITGQIMGFPRQVANMFRQSPGPVPVDRLEHSKKSPFHSHLDGGKRTRKVKRTKKKRQRTKVKGKGKDS